MYDRNEMMSVVFFNEMKFNKVLVDLLVAINYFSFNDYIPFFIKEFYDGNVIITDQCYPENELCTEFLVKYNVSFNLESLSINFNIENSGFTKKDVNKMIKLVYKERLFFIISKDEIDISIDGVFYKTLYRDKPPTNKVNKS